MWSGGSRMIESDIGDEAVALVRGWARVLAEPRSSKRLFFKDLVPVAEEYIDEFAVDVGLLASISGNPGDCYSLDQIRKGGGGGPFIPLAGVRLEGDQRPTHLLNNEFNLFLIALCLFFSFGPLNPEGSIEVRVLSRG